MSKSNRWLPFVVIVLALSGLQAARCDEPVQPAKTTAAAKRQTRQAAIAKQKKTTVSAAPAPARFTQGGSPDVYRTPTGSHIPQKYHVAGRDADTNLPLTVIGRDDIDALDEGGSLGNVLRRFPSVYVSGR